MNHHGDVDDRVTISLEQASYHRHVELPVFSFLDGCTSISSLASTERRNRRSGESAGRHLWATSKNECGTREQASLLTSRAPFMTRQIHTSRNLDRIKIFPTFLFCQTCLRGRISSKQMLHILGIVQIIKSHAG